MQSVLIVWDGDYPWDVRVEKVANTLIQAGYIVHLVSRNSLNRERRESIGGVNVRRVIAGPRWFKASSPYLTFPLFVSPIWVSEIVSAVREVKPAIIIVRDLPMAPAALAVGRATRVPVIMDMAECYPEMLKCAWTFERRRVANYLVRNPTIASIIEKLVVRRLDQIWVMVEESAERLFRLGVKKDAVKVVSNTPVCMPSEATLERDYGEDGKAKIVYVGLLNPSRGLDTLLDAMKIIEKTRPGSITLLVAGAGKHESHLKSKISSLGLGGIVSMLGWVNHEEIVELISNADVGIVPHYKCSHWDNTIPNKLFDYMAAGVPVLTSDAEPAKRIVDQVACGLSYSSFSVDDLVEKLTLLCQRQLRQTYGRAGVRAILERYNWNVDANAMLAAMRRHIRSG